MTVHCPVHGTGYGRCLGCLLEALYGIRHIENPAPPAWLAALKEAR